jgi:hypothetical protein
MTKHRTITGFVAVALLAVAAATTMRSHTSWTSGIVVASGPTSPQDVATDANGPPAADFNDRWSAISVSPASGQTSPQPSP